MKALIVPTLTALATLMVPLVSSAPLSAGASNHPLFKRDLPECDAALGNPTFPDCMNALYQMPSGTDFGHFVRPNDNPPPVGTTIAQGGPWFYQAGACVIAVFVEDTDYTAWVIVKSAAEEVVYECVDDARTGGSVHVGQSDHVRVIVFYQEYTSNAASVHDSSSNETDSCEWEEVSTGNPAGVRACPADTATPGGG